ncbi:MAG: hypothetical protein ABH879_06700 [archaeon]
MNRIFPYTLPIASAILIVALLVRPEITGFAVLGPGGYLDINLDPGDYQVIPESAIMRITVNNNSRSATVGEFVRESESAHSYGLGRLDVVNYTGFGYFGNNTYRFMLGNLESAMVPGENQIAVEISFGDKIIHGSNSSIRI